MYFNTGIDRNLFNWVYIVILMLCDLIILIQYYVIFYTAKK